MEGHVTDKLQYFVPDPYPFPKKNADRQVGGYIFAMEEAGRLHQQNLDIAKGLGKKSDIGELANPIGSVFGENRDYYADLENYSIACLFFGEMYVPLLEISKRDNNRIKGKNETDFLPKLLSNMKRKRGILDDRKRYGS
jgi:hypothetical protein